MIEIDIKSVSVKIVKGGVSALPVVDTNKQLGVALKVRYSKDSKNENDAIKQIRNFRDKQLQPFLKFKESIISHTPRSRYSWVAVIYE